MATYTCKNITFNNNKLLFIITQFEIVWCWKNWVKWFYTTFNVSHEVWIKNIKYTRLDEVLKNITIIIVITIITIMNNWEIITKKVKGEYSSIIIAQSWRDCSWCSFASSCIQTPKAGRQNAVKLIPTTPVVQHTSLKVYYNNVSV